MPATRKAVVFLVAGFCIAAFSFFAATAHALQDDADKMCDANTYDQNLDYPRINQKTGKQGLIGLPCRDITAKDEAASGFCVGALDCKATLCDGKPCKTTDVKVDESLNKPSAALPDAIPKPPVQEAPKEPVPASPSTQRSLLEQLMFDPKPFSEQKNTLSPSAENVGELIKQADAEPGFIDKVREKIGSFFSPDITGKTGALDNSSVLEPGSQPGGTFEGIPTQPVQTTPEHTFGEQPTDAFGSAQSSGSWWSRVQEVAQTLGQGLYDYITNPGEVPAVESPTASVDCGGDIICIAQQGSGYQGTLEGQTSDQARQTVGDPINVRTTLYGPGAGGMQGGWETSKPNLEGEYIPRTLDDVRLGKSDYVTLASDPINNGKYFDLGKVTYRSPIDGKTYTLNNVTGYVHDTGSSFAGRPDKFDVAVADFRGWSNQQATQFLTAGSGYDDVTHTLQQVSGPSATAVASVDPWSSGTSASVPYVVASNSYPSSFESPDSSTYTLADFQPEPAIGNESPNPAGEVVASNLPPPSGSSPTLAELAVQGYQEAPPNTPDVAVPESAPIPEPTPSWIDRVPPSLNLDAPVDPNAPPPSQPEQPTTVAEYLRGLTRGLGLFGGGEVTQSSSLPAPVEPAQANFDFAGFGANPVGPVQFGGSLADITPNYGSLVPVTQPADVNFDVLSGPSYTADQFTTGYDASTYAPEQKIDWPAFASGIEDFKLPPVFDESMLSPPPEPFVQSGEEITAQFNRDIESGIPAPDLVTSEEVQASLQAETLRLASEQLRQDALQNIPTPEEIQANLDTEAANLQEQLRLSSQGILPNSGFGQLLAETGNWFSRQWDNLSGAVSGQISDILDLRGSISLGEQLGQMTEPAAPPIIPAEAYDFTYPTQQPILSEAETNFPESPLTPPSPIAETKTPSGGPTAATDNNVTTNQDIQNLINAYPGSSFHYFDENTLVGKSGLDGLVKELPQTRDLSPQEQAQWADGARRFLTQNPDALRQFSPDVTVRRGDVFFRGSGAVDTSVFNDSRFADTIRSQERVLASGLGGGAGVDRFVASFSGATLPVASPVVQIESPTFPAVDNSWVWPDNGAVFGMSAAEMQNFPTVDSTWAWPDNGAAFGESEAARQAFYQEYVGNLAVEGLGGPASPDLVHISDPENLILTSNLDTFGPSSAEVQAFQIPLPDDWWAQEGDLFGPSADEVQSIQESNPAPNASGSTDQQPKEDVPLPRSRPEEADQAEAEPEKSASEIAAEKAALKQQTAKSLVSHATTAKRGLDTLNSLMAEATPAQRASMSAGRAATGRMLAEATAIGDRELAGQIRQYLGLQRSLEANFRLYQHGQVNGFTLMGLRTQVVISGNNVVSTAQQRYRK